MCALAPKVSRRDGAKIVTKESKLYHDILDAVQDRDTAWDMWAYTKTNSFKNTYENLEHDEMGEVTFPSLIHALNLDSVYEEQKGISEKVKEYGFGKKVFDVPQEAIRQVNDFNRKEDRFIAVLRKSDAGYNVEVYHRTPGKMEAARQQSFNSALAGEILDLLQQLGFDVGWSEDPKFEGMFDPQNATLQDGLLQVIKIAKGEVGEQALPEEFAHLIIEGLARHPLVQRLLNSLDIEQVREVLGEQFDDYAREYDNNAERLKKEVAGRMLAQHIKKQGTISPRVVERKKTLLGRIWNWAKNLFSRITGKHIANARMNAENAVADIYNLIKTREVIPLIDRDSIISADTLYRLQNEYEDLEHMADAAITVLASKLDDERKRSMTGRGTKETREALTKAQQDFEGGQHYKSILTVLQECNRQFIDLRRRARSVKNELAAAGNPTDMKAMKKLAVLEQEIKACCRGYEPLLRDISVVNIEENMEQLNLTQASADILADRASKNLEVLRILENQRAKMHKNVILNATRSQYQEDKVRGIGSKRNEVMELSVILDHAARDINFVDRLFSAMSDADDALLGIIDSIVKQQKFERDEEMVEINAQIAVADKELREAGYTADFILERDEKGTPTGRILSDYDWDTYREEYYQVIAKAYEDYPDNSTKRARVIKNWREGYVGGQPRTIKIYVDPELQRRYEAGERNLPDDRVEVVPNPKVYDRYQGRIERLAPAQKTYYKKMMDLKRQMMLQIPKRGQYLYRAIFISKSDIEGILTNRTGNVLNSIKEAAQKRYERRPDDIGFGTTENLPADITEILEKEKDPKEAADKIVKLLAASLDDDVITEIRPQKLQRIVQRNKDNIKKAVEDITEYLTSLNYYLVDVDMAGNRIQRLPIYYTRRLRDMNMMSTDFSGCMLAYCAMATNYAKMDEVVDILEVLKDHVLDRDVRENEGDQPIVAQAKVLGKRIRRFVNKAEGDRNINGRIEDYFKSVVYEERKEDEGGLLGSKVDQAKLLDTIKDYNGLIGLGLNLFSTISNITVGKIQQWIEAAGGEYFTFKDYAKAIGQYSTLILPCVAEMSSNLKTSRLGLLIQKFDPAGEFFEGLRGANFYKSPVSRILGNGALAYIGMNAGEHMLRCQTMLAILNHVKLKTSNSKDAEEISLYDALEEVKGDDGITRLQLKKGLYYVRELIDQTGTKESNKNFGKPLRDENGKIMTEFVSLDDEKNQKTFLRKQRKKIRKVNDTLNGAFSADEKGAAHRKALWRMALQFRQWMPAHYMRRFSRAHYDSDLEQWREGYYVTLGKTLPMILKKELGESRLRWAALKDTLSDHEKANLRRAMSEISLYCMMWFLVKIGGKAKDKDKSWAEKMAIYQLYRMKLEVGASVPGPEMYDNIWQVLRSPIPQVKTFDNILDFLNVFHLMDEVESGPYEGWNVWWRDVIKGAPLGGQVAKAVIFDDAILTGFENKRNY